MYYWSVPTAAAGISLLFQLLLLGVLALYGTYRVYAVRARTRTPGSPVPEAPWAPEEATETPWAPEEATGTP